MNQSEVMEALRGIQGAWTGFILNPRFKRLRSMVTWEADRRERFGDQILLPEFEKLASEKQYSFQLFDGSLIQLYYEFSENGDSLRESHLAYIQTPKADPSESRTQDRVDVDGTSLVIEEVRRVEYPAAWLRIDFEPQYWAGCIHANCHMHSSMSPDIRMPFAGVPSPNQFVDAIAAWFYPKLYRRAFLNEMHKFKDVGRVNDVVNQRMIVQEDPHCHALIHLTLPRVFRTAPALPPG